MLNNSIPGFDRQDFKNRFWDLYHQQVRTFKDCLAVITSTSSIRYKDLNNKANHIAHVVSEKSQTAQLGIGLLLTDVFKITPSFIGVLKSNNYVVILDPAFPETRLIHMIGESDIRAIITDNEHLPAALNLGISDSLIINFDLLVMDADIPDPDMTFCETDIVQILFSSGSTGQPKGVIEHYGYLFRNVYNNILRYQVTHHDRYLNSHSFNFAGAHNSLLTCLFSGATFAHYPVDKEGLAGFKQFLQEKKITLYFSTPTIFRTFLPMLSPEDLFPEIRSVQLGGEKRLLQDFTAFQKHFSSESTFSVTYATSETQVLTFNRFTQNSNLNAQVLPSGFPEDGIDLFIWDENGNELPAGEEGEIVVRGSAFARGYTNSPSLTREKFLSDPNDPNKQIYRTGDVGKILPDGQLQHIRRIDDQVKIKGIRIELGNVESQLISYPGIIQAAVKIFEDKNGISKLAVYYVTEDNASIPIHDLRSFLSEKLPAVMIPQYFIQVEILPMTGTNKIDLESLPIPGKVRPELGNLHRGPSNDLEKELVLIWEEVLELEKVGIDEEFFILGGDSITAMKIISRVNKVFEIDFPMRALMRSPTIIMMAEEISQIMIENLTSE